MTIQWSIPRTAEINRGNGWERVWLARCREYAVIGYSKREVEAQIPDQPVRESTWQRG